VCWPPGRGKKKIARKKGKNKPPTRKGEKKRGGVHTGRFPKDRKKKKKNSAHHKKIVTGGVPFLGKGETKQLGVEKKLEEPGGRKKKKGMANGRHSKNCERGWAKKKILADREGGEPESFFHSEKVAKRLKTDPATKGDGSNLKKGKEGSGIPRKK